MYKIDTFSTDNLAIGNINFVLDLASWRIIHLDGQLANLLKSIATLNSETLLSLIHSDDLAVVYQAYHKLVEEEIVGLVKVRLVLPEKTVWLGIMPFLIYHGSAVLMVANVQIITREVENLETTLKFANKKNSILQMLSHDLRGPLTIAQSLIKVIEENNGSADVLNRIEAVSLIINDTISMITDLVDKEFIDTMEAPLVKRRVDVVKKLNEYIDQCKHAEHLSAKNFTLVSSASHIALQLDEAKFMQVVNNLISNSLKFTQANGKIQIIIDEYEEYVSIVFKDDGVGIPKVLQPYIFDRNTMAKRNGLNGEPTTGLGLFIVKEIVNWHGGTIECQSDEGEGCSFIIKFPKEMETF